MIKNERQYRISRAQLDRFETALAEFERGEGAHPGTHPRLVQAEADAMRSQIEEFREEIAEYDALSAGKKTVLELDSFGALPRALIRARIAAGLSQKGLAERLGLKEQQVQRYEATEYASASISRIGEVIDALGVKLRNEVVLPQASFSLADLLARLRRAGLDPGFVSKRLAPLSVIPHLEDAQATRKEEPRGVVLQMADCLSRVFRWSWNEVLTGAELRVGAAPLGEARLKVSSGAEKRRLSVYSVYAHYLALLVLEITRGPPQRDVPSNAREVRREVLSAHESLELENVLDYVWDLGIPVLPLDDPGAFHGACWRVDGRNIIVLKQRTSSQARWLHDLLHELYHAGQEPDERDRGLIEADENGVDVRDHEEEEAATFAGDVVLDGRAEELVEMCVNAASGSVERLKKALPRVASRENVAVGALANYMAFRLSLQGVNWWGAASNLQPRAPRPFSVARDVLLSRVDLSPLNQVDRGLLLRALSNEEDQTDA